MVNNKSNQNNKLRVIIVVLFLLIILLIFFAVVGVLTRSSDPDIQEYNISHDTYIPSPGDIYSSESIKEVVPAEEHQELPLSEDIVSTKPKSVSSPQETYMSPSEKTVPDFNENLEGPESIFISDDTYID
ncbi:MAG: hypothetical protein U9P50_03490 [Patescibacteria group bacterium]|nr:hypothetical protein [Patescibacteria group bacterium]